MVDGAVQKAIAKLKKQKDEDGYWLRQYYDFMKNLTTDVTDATEEAEEGKRIRATYLDKLQSNKANRFEESKIVSTLGILDSSLLHEIPPLYGIGEIADLAEYFGLPDDDVHLQWDQLLDVIKVLPNNERSLNSGLKFLTTENSHTGILSQVPHMEYLFSVALSLP